MEERELIRGEFRFPIGYFLGGSFVIGFILVILLGVFSRSGLSVMVGIYIAPILSILFAIIVRSTWNLTITNRRVYGKVGLFKQLDLPMDSVTSVMLDGISRITVSTPSGMIHFGHLRNRTEVFQVLSGLIAERQEKVTVQTIVQPTQPTNTNADELEKYKKLLDNGTITQEEFDAKKKQLLGL